MNAHSPSAIEAQAAVDRISRSGQSTGPEGASSVAILSDSFAPQPCVGADCATFKDRTDKAAQRQPQELFGVRKVRHSHFNRLPRGVAETSAEAFHSLPVADYLAPKERAILGLFTGPDVRMSRQQISVALPMPINGVCGRVDSLLAAGHLEESGDRIDPLTRKRQKLLQLPRDGQALLPGVSA